MYATRPVIQIFMNALLLSEGLDQMLRGAAKVNGAVIGRSMKESFPPGGWEIKRIADFVLKNGEKLLAQAALVDPEAPLEPVYRSEAEALRALRRKSKSLPHS